MISIASKLCYRYTDVMALTGFGKSAAYEIMRQCRETYDGAIPMRPDAITAKSLMDYFKTTKEEYIRGLKAAE